MKYYKIQLGSSTWYYQVSHDIIKNCYRSFIHDSKVIIWDKEIGENINKVVGTTLREEITKEEFFIYCI